MQRTRRHLVRFEVDVFAAWLGDLGRLAVGLDRRLLQRLAL